MSTVRLKHPEGVAMRFGELLTAYLVNRVNKHQPFMLGQWLKVLDDDTLEQLTALAEMMVDGTAEEMDLPADDLVMTCIVAEAAEKRLPSVSVSPESLFERLSHLVICASMETYSRRGWVELEGELSICDSEVSIRLTDEGMRAGEQMRMFVN